MSRRNQILALVLVVQIVLGVVVFWPRTVASDTGGGPLFPDFEADEVTALTIVDSEDNRVTLAKNGEAWVLPEADDYPADSEKITPILEKIEGIETDRLVTRTDASHRRLQVAGDDFSRRLEISLADDGQRQLYVGSSAGASATHVRAADQSEVYLTGELTPFEVNAQASSWIDTLYFTVPQTATVALTLENSNGTFEFEREGDSWTMAGLAADETLNQNSVTSLASQASSIRMTEPIGTEEQATFGLEEPQATITLETAEETYTLRIGAQNEEDDSYILASSDSPYYVRIAGFTGNNFVDKTRDDFLEAPPAEGAADPQTVQ